MIHQRFRSGSIVPVLGLVASLATVATKAETLNTLEEYGNAATANAESDGVPPVPRGFNPIDTVAGEYTMTSGGTDFWGTTDHGAFLYDSTTTRVDGEDFSAVVLSTWIAQDTNEILADEWGRTGIIARPAASVSAADSPYVGHFRKHGWGTNAANNPDRAYTMLQGRNTTGGGTDRTGGQFANGAANLAVNGTVRETPFWIGLHRVDGTYYATWADDVGGMPGTWSPSMQRAGVAETQGEVYVGLAHQSHNINPIINTALFENFSVGPFDADLGAFPSEYVCDISFSGTEIFLSAYRDELGIPQDVDWEVHFLGADEIVPDGLKADIYDDDATEANRNNIINNTLPAPDGSTFIPNINWARDAGIKYPDELPDVDNTLGTRNLFNEALPSRAWTGDEGSYGVHLTGEIHIPNDADRDGLEYILFHDGVDDFCYLEIDGQVIINDNDWANWNGSGNGGAGQGEMDVSDAKFDDGEWVTMRYGMWEGSGGDSGQLCWSALDSDTVSGTGIDSVTSGTDSSLNSYLGFGYGLTNKEDFLNDASDQVPTQNLRGPQPSVVDPPESGSGQPNMLLLSTPIAPATQALVVYLDGKKIKTVPVIPTLDTADFTDYDQATITLLDVGTGGTADVDLDTLVVTRDGTTVTPTTLSKTDQTTTIVDTLPTEPEVLTNHTYVVTGNTTEETGETPFEFTATVISFPIREELRAGLGTPPNATTGWDYMEFDVTEVMADLGATGLEAYRNAQEVIATATPVAAPQPYINHHDPDASVNPYPGDWSSDLTILLDTPGVIDEQRVTYARTIVSVANAGDMTFRVHGDDGYALRVTGASFTSVAGDGTNYIHPIHKETVCFPDFTGDSNAYAVCNFPAAGDYTVEFFGFQGGGTNHQELGWAPGALTNNQQSYEWALVGDMTDWVGSGVSKMVVPEGLIPAVSETEPGWATHWFYNCSNPAVNDINGTLLFLRRVDDGTNTVGSQFDSDYEGVEYMLNHGNGGVIGGNLTYPGTPSADRIALLAKAVIICPVDGTYTLQVRSDDGCLMRFLDPANKFSKINLGATRNLHPNYPSEVWHTNGTGNADIRAVCDLTAGAHEIIFSWWEGNGGDYVEVSVAAGEQMDGGNNAPPFEVLDELVKVDQLYLGTAIVPTDDGIKITDIRHLGATVELDIAGLDSAEIYKVYRDTTLPLGASKVQIGSDITGTTSTMVTDAGPLPVDAYYQVEQQ